MSSPVAELEAGLNAMQSLKPPGVSGSRIQSLTTLCVENVQVRLRKTLSFIVRGGIAVPSMLTRISPVAVRIRTHPEDLHPLQEGPSYS